MNALAAPVRIPASSFAEANDMGRATVKDFSGLCTQEHAELCRDVTAILDAEARNLPRRVFDEDREVNWLVSLSARMNKFSSSKCDISAKFVSKLQSGWESAGLWARVQFDFNEPHDAPDLAKRLLATAADEIEAEAAAAGYGTLKT